MLFRIITKQQQQNKKQKTQLVPLQEEKGRGLEGDRQ